MLEVNIINNQQLAILNELVQEEKTRRLQRAKGDVSRTNLWWLEKQIAALERKKDHMEVTKGGDTFPSVSVKAKPGLNKFRNKGAEDLFLEKISLKTLGRPSCYSCEACTPICHTIGNELLPHPPKVTMAQTLDRLYYNPIRQKNLKESTEFTPLQLRSALTLYEQERRLPYKLSKAASPSTHLYHLVRSTISLASVVAVLASMCSQDAVVVVVFCGAVVCVAAEGVPRKRRRSSTLRRARSSVVSELETVVYTEENEHEKKQKPKKKKGKKKRGNSLQN